MISIELQIFKILQYFLPKNGIFSKSCVSLQAKYHGKMKNELKTGCKNHCDTLLV